MNSNCLTVSKKRGRKRKSQINLISPSQLCNALKLSHFYNPNQDTCMPNLDSLINQNSSSNLTNQTINSSSPKNFSTNSTKREENLNNLENQLLSNLINQTANSNGIKDLNCLKDSISIEIANKMPISSFKLPNQTPTFSKQTVPQNQDQITNSINLKNSASTELANQMPSFYLVNQPPTFSTQIVQQDREILNKLDSMNNRLSSIEKEILKQNFTKQSSNNSIDDDQTEIESIDEENLFSKVEKLERYNYLTWKKQLIDHLEKFKLDHFLFKSYSDESSDKDEKVKNLILTTISSKYKSKLNFINYDKIKSHELFEVIKSVFFDEFAKKKKENLNYITRKDVQAISQIKDHVSNFQKAVTELIAIDFRFSDKVLIELFLNSMSNYLPHFSLMIQEHICIHKLKFIEALDHCYSMSYHYIKISCSNEPIQLKKEQIDPEVVNSDNKSEGEIIRE